ncbi:MAG: hypothetical protein WAL59_11195 [Roseiarcus sp.]
MIVGEIRSQIPSGTTSGRMGSNPLSVMEQITYFLFIERLDELQTLEERKATALGKPIRRRIFPEGNDPRGGPYADLRWSNFRARMMSITVTRPPLPFNRGISPHLHYWTA